MDSPETDRVGTRGNGQRRKVDPLEVDRGLQGKKSGAWKTGCRGMGKLDHQTGESPRKEAYHPEIEMQAKKENQKPKDMFSQSNSKRY